jgi:hypothetical protein
MREVIAYLIMIAVSQVLFYCAVYLLEEIYAMLFGVLYRNVSKDYAEPVSFWLTMALPVSCLGWSIHLFIKFNF